MSLDPDQVQKIAKLAQLNLPEESMSELVHDLTRILNMVEQLRGVNTQDVVPMAHPLNGSQRLRLDKVTESDLHVELQFGAPLVEQSLYLVPKVID